MDNPNINKHITLKIQSLLPLVSLFSCLVFGFGQSTVYSYQAEDNIAVNCGSQTQAFSQTQRLWLADTSDPNVFTFLDHSNATSTVSNLSKTSEAYQPPQSRGDRVPYITARLSLSPFTYSFSVSPGQKFIRLHFYSAYYPGFENYSPFFSVKTGVDGHFILLNNFTALASAVDDSDTMIKEFCINMGEGERLNITFTPSSTISNTYAFINGIEIVSMPTDLYYNNPTYKYQPQQVDNHGALYAVENNTALELMYRLNVGGNGISPHEDTGMYREWDVDYSYLHVDFPFARPVDGNYEVDLKFSMVKNFTAPELVYRTAISMGPNTTSNERHNLTYTFLVDTGFAYLVRLHFCELLNITANERVFEIYAATFLAEHSADVVKWSGESRNGIPLYRDYAVMIGNIEGAKETVKQNLSIQLHPAESWRTVVPDVMLSGIEIFKISNDGDLSGTHLYLPTTKPPSVSPINAPPSANNQSKYAIIGGVPAGVAVLSFLAFFIIRQRRKLNMGKDAATSSDSWTSWYPFTSFNTTNKSTKSQNSTLPSALCRHFWLSEIKAATNNFDEVFIIGFGGFGDVYKGFISSLSTEVAIKRLKQGSKQGATEFKTEIEMLSQLRHLHLVSLIGYCDQDNEMILVYDYMSRGTLQDHLYSTDNPPLSWDQRLEICLGAARGLQYLHTGMKHPIIHRDVKSTNILLNEKWVAKVSDFGLSKINYDSSSKAHISTVVKGSIGYLDPEYYRRRQLTEKSDVYSFGVVLCEVFCARSPTDKLIARETVSLAEWFRKSYRNGKLNDIVDPSLRKKIAPECLKKFANLVVRCLSENGVDRPSMNDVVWELEFALQIQQTAREQVIEMKLIDDQKSHGKEVELDDADVPSKFECSSKDDGSQDLFSIRTGVVMDSKIASDQEQSFLSNSSSDMTNWGVVLQEVMDRR